MRFLFYYSQLNIGGAEKSLVRLMNGLVKAGHSVTYLGRYSNGAAEYLLDKKVKCMSLSKPLNRTDKWNFLCSMVRSGIQRALSIAELRNLPEFDVAFVGLQGLSPELVVNKIKTKRICIFIRSDVSRLAQKNKVVGNLRRYLGSIDSFICVARTVKTSLINSLPEAEDKAQVIYNLLDVDDMKRKMDNAINPFAEESPDVFKIVSVCRISDKSKGVFRMVDIAKKLVEEGYIFKWYIVGDGADLLPLRQRITEAGLREFMITPGKIDNPFGYYRHCDLVAMLSYYEGLCGVVNEAKIAGKAIIATEVSGIHEQLTHDINGWIVDNNEAAILDGLRHLLSSPVEVKKLSNEIYPRELTDDKQKIEQIISIVNQ